MQSIIVFVQSIINVALGDHTSLNGVFFYPKREIMMTRNTLGMIPAKSYTNTVSLFAKKLK